MNMWAGAGVGGLRTPARCLDSIRAYPATGYLNLRIGYWWPFAPGGFVFALNVGS